MAGQTTLVPVCEQDQVVLAVVNISVLISRSKVLTYLLHGAESFLRS